MSSDAPATPLPRTGYFFSEAAIYELKQLRNQLNLMSCLSAACGGDEDNEPTMAIHRWYASFENMERQVDRIMSQSEWISVRAPEAGDGSERKVLKRKRAMR
ncbi:XAC0095 family protein [Pseudoxanthomonas beigongshangi]|uniref:XAC0095 family protein n=1 Tax=Pseudoxanthomonas beigongshangi TaxID=2782537 RepID=UPI00193C0F44|nr:hypothetical protein [Pseudoxanthomonas beigongshangi]